MDGCMSAGFGTKPLVLWPYHLNAYRDCPLRYYLKYVRKRKGKVVVQPALTRGRVTHEVLADSLKYYRSVRVFPNDLRDRVAKRLPDDDYDNRDQWSSDVEMIDGWVEQGFSSIEQGSEILAVEHVYHYPYRGGSRCGPFTLNSKVDLVLRRPGGVLEHIDWKTGGRKRVDHIQNVSCRLGVGKELGETGVRTTNVFLALGDTHTEQLARDDVKPTWRAIQELVDRIASCDDFEPQPGPLCAWCPFYGGECPVH
jgi:hypothetical protein